MLNKYKTISSNTTSSKIHVGFGCRKAETRIKWAYTGDVARTVYTNCDPMRSDPECNESFAF